MKLKLQIWEKLVTERLHEVEINSSDYPELKGKTTDETQKYIDDNMWEMSPPDENFDTQWTNKGCASEFNSDCANLCGENPDFASKFHKMWQVLYKSLCF